MRIHILRNYDTLERLSMLYKIPICMIVRANGFTKAEDIKHCKKLRIPNPCYCKHGAVSNCDDCIRFTYKKYIVRPGDTIMSISQKFGTTANAIMKKNGVANIQPGDVLSVPSPSESFLVYTVGTIDTMSQISEKFNVEQNIIIRYNNIKAGQGIYPGMQLIIPLF